MKNKGDFYLENFTLINLKSLFYFYVNFIIPLLFGTLNKTTYEKIQFFVPSFALKVK